MTEFSAEQGGVISVELLLLPDARLQSSNHDVRAAREGLPKRRRVQGEQVWMVFSQKVNETRTFLDSIQWQVGTERRVLAGISQLFGDDSFSVASSDTTAFLKQVRRTNGCVLQVYLAQSLYKAGMYPEATRAAVRVDSPQYQQRMIALQVSAEGTHYLSGHPLSLTLTVLTVQIVISHQERICESKKRNWHSRAAVYFQIALAPVSVDICLWTQSPFDDFLFMNHLLRRAYPIGSLMYLHRPKVRSIRLTLLADVNVSLRQNSHGSKPTQDS